MTDDRDRRTPKTPPKGIAEQIARPLDKRRAPSDIEWAPDTGVHPRDENTPVGNATLSAEEEKHAAERRLQSRVKETNITSAETAKAVEEVKGVADKTHVGVETLRMEMVSHVERLDGSIGTVKADVQAIKADVKTLGGHVLNALGTVNEAITTVNKFQGDIVRGQLDKQTISFEAHVDVEKTAKVTAIADEADSKKARRDRYGKILTIIGGLVGLATAAFAAGRC